MDGLTATVKIRRHFPEDRQHKIGALTAYILPDSDEWCLAAGMNGYIVTPAGMDSIRTTLEKFLMGDGDA